MAISRDGKKLYEVNGRPNSVSAIYTVRNVKLRDIAVGKLPWAWLAIKCGQARASHNDQNPGRAMAVSTSHAWYLCPDGKVMALDSRRREFGSGEKLVENDYDMEPRRNMMKYQGFALWRWSVIHSIHDCLPKAAKLAVVSHVVFDGVPVDLP